MSASLVLASLTPEFRAKVETLLANCQTAGVIMVPYFGLRNPVDQAKLWRRSRSALQVSQTVATLRENYAPYLAGVLDGVGPQPAGEWATNALPGQSWHEFAEAVDCYVEHAGKPAWDAADPGYEVYASQAEALGLTAGKRWTTPDTDHVQMPTAASPLSIMSWAEIDAAMKANFSPS